MENKRLDLISYDGKIILALLRRGKALKAIEISNETGINYFNLHKTKLPALVEKGFLEKGSGDQKRTYKLSEEFRDKVLKNLPKEYNDLVKQIVDLQKQRESLLIQALLKTIRSSSKE